jgi:hypothetical protein
VHYAFLSSAHERGLSRLKRRLRRPSIAGSDRFLDIADGAAHARATRFVDDGPPRNLSGRLLGGFGISHRISRFEHMADRMPRTIDPLKKGNGGEISPPPARL